MTTPINDCVRDFLEARSLLNPVRPILAAVSGGPDSVGLLHVLKDLGVPVRAAHFNHGARNGASDDDATFVRELCGRLDVPCDIGTASDATGIELPMMASEEALRDARYAFLIATARRHGCIAIATAHHADDQAETVLMRVLRGASPAGLAGIPEDTKRDGVRIVRPLLRVPKADIEAYLVARGAGYRIDASNFERNARRNLVRHELLPRLARDFNPQVRDALCRLAETQRVDNAYLDRKTDAWLASARTGSSLDREVFRKAHTALQRRAVLRMAWEAGVELTFDQTIRAVNFIRDAASGKRLTVTHDLMLENTRETTSFLHSTPAEPAETSAIPLAVPGQTTAFHRTFIVRDLDQLPADVPAYCTPARQVFDAAALASRPAIRLYRPGDRFRPLGMTGHRDIKDLLRESGVPRSQRPAVPLVTANDTVLWVVGHAVSADAAVSVSTRRAIEIEVVDETG